MLAAATLMSAGPVAGAGLDTKVLEVHVENHAHVTASVLERAEKLAAEIYAAAGVRIVWVDDDEVSRPVAAFHVRVILLSRDMSEALAKADGIADDVLGEARRPLGRAWVLCSRLMDVSGDKQIFTADLLGKVIAHEIGHLLSAGHSTRGIMQASFRRYQYGPQEFTAEQAVSVRASLETRR